MWVSEYSESLLNRGPSLPQSPLLDINWGHTSTYYYINTHFKLEFSLLAEHYIGSQWAPV